MHNQQHRMCYVPSPKDLSSEQSYRIESIQKRAVKIIYGHYCTDYETTCSQLNIYLLENQEIKSFCRKSVMDSKSCLHCLLLEPRGDFVDKLRRKPLSFVLPTAKINRCEFL